MDNNSSTTKVDKQIPWSFSTSPILSFKSTENNHDVYRGKGCIKKYSKVEEV